MAADVVDGAITLQFLQEDTTSEEEEPGAATGLDLALGGNDCRACDRGGRLLGGGLLRGFRDTISRVNA